MLIEVNIIVLNIAKYEIECNAYSVRDDKTFSKICILV